MQTRALGRNGPELSVVGLGAWAMGGDGWIGSWGPQQDTESMAAIHRALDDGVNWIDTAPIYGLGHSEEVVGRAIASRRDEVFVATKVTNRWHADRTVYRSGAAASIVEECDQSLARLGIEHIDLLQVHQPPDDVPIEETWGALADLQDQGKVRYLGLSNASVEDHERCLAIRHVDSTQPHYNLLLRGIEDGILDLCGQHGIGVVPYGPMYEGLLSGSFDPARLQGDDFRKREEWQPRIDLALRATERLREVAAGHGLSVGQLAIAWVLGDRRITSAIVGARRPEQVAQNAAVGRVDCDLAAIRAEVDDAVGDLLDAA